MAIHLISINTLSELKATKGTEENVIITLGQTAKGDNKGALFYWDAASSEAEDNLYYNVVQVTGVTTGRWKKVFTRMMQLPHGTLVINAGKKEFFFSGTTNANSECSVNLTMDGTATGLPIFTDVWFDDSKATVNTTNSNDAVSSFRKSLSTDLKLLTHGFYKGNNSVVSLLGATVLGFRGSGTGISVKFKIEGI